MGIRGDTLGRGAPVPFEAVSSYKMDYVQKPMRPKSAACAPAKERATETGPFNGLTTYNVDYHKHPLETQGGAKGSAHVPTLETSDAPFNGVTEYHREFVPLASA